MVKKNATGDGGPRKVPTKQTGVPCRWAVEKEGGVNIHANTQKGGKRGVLFGRGTAITSRALVVQKKTLGEIKFEGGGKESCLVVGVAPIHGNWGKTFSTQCGG